MRDKYCYKLSRKQKGEFKKSVLPISFKKWLKLRWEFSKNRELAWQCRRYKRHRFDPWARKIPWRQPNPVFLPGESHGQRSLMGYSPCDCRVGRDWSDSSTHQIPTYTSSELWTQEECSFMTGIGHWSVQALLRRISGWRKVWRPGEAGTPDLLP